MGALLLAAIFWIIVIAIAVWLALNAGAVLSGVGSVLALGVGLVATFWAEIGTVLVILAVLAAFLMLNKWDDDRLAKKRAAKGPWERHLERLANEAQPPSSPDSH